MFQQCEKIKHNKERCKAYAISQSNLCFWHNPKMEKKRTEARKRGGQNRRKDYGESIIEHKIEYYEDIQRVIEITLNDLMRDKITASKARAIGNLCNQARTIQRDVRYEIKGLPF